MDTKK